MWGRWRDSDFGLLMAMARRELQSWFTEKYATGLGPPSDAEEDKKEEEKEGSGEEGSEGEDGSDIDRSGDEMEEDGEEAEEHDQAAHDLEDGGEEGEEEMELDA